MERDLSNWSLFKGKTESKKKNIIEEKSVLLSLAYLVCLVVGRLYKFNL